MRNRILLYLLITALFGVYSCSEKEKNREQQDYRIITLEGKIQNPKNQPVVLYKPNGLRPIPVDTAEVNAAGEFRMEIAIDQPDIYTLNFYGNQNIPLVLEQQDLFVEVDGSSPNGMQSVSGSEEMEKLSAFLGELREFQMQEFDLLQEYRESVVARDVARQEQLEKKSYQLRDEKQELAKNAIVGIGPSLAVMPLVEILDKDQNFEFLIKLAEDLSGEYPDSERVQSLYTSMKAIEPVTIGKIAPDFTLPDVEGDPVSLSSFRGKYVLVDFWAAWCKPCRAENPNIVAAYQKYKNQEFDILGVSLDRTRNAWLEAIEEDNLSWTQVSDLKYFNSEAVKMYNINAIPFSLLLDPEGRIIAKNLRGAKLENELEKIFSGS